MRSLPESTLQQFGIQRCSFSEEKVLPRLLFGQYLESQFQSMLERAAGSAMDVVVHLNTTVTDLSDEPRQGKISLTLADRACFSVMR